MQITTVESVGMMVADMERSLDFYTTVLASKKIADHEVAGVELDRLYGLANIRLRVATLQLGKETIELIEFLTPKGRPIPSDSRSNDRWFQHMAIVVRDMEQAYHHLRQHWVLQTSPNPQTLPEWNPVAGDIQSFYFKDLDGHNLELIHFPDGKGDPKWQGSTEALFLGIDHTAIVVANTAASRAFYCDRLGMKLQQESQNFGSEQERLSGVPDVQVHISSLKAPTGLGLELLEYVQPNHGRPIPTDTSANDLWCWQTTIAIEDVSAKVQQLQAFQSQPISSEVISVSASSLAFNQSFFIQDPDGHTIRLVKR
jgi:catechol 2,3-dioxygenase-like lactoylglutathione lyase family enzyme